jgi:DnaK suppressor protein
MKKPGPASRRTGRSDRARTNDDVRDRLLAERQAAIEELARLGFAAEHDDATGTGESPFEEGDVAQASERLDMSFMHRERVAERINRLTRALERVAQGRYGTCEDCARAIEPARLAAAPEATVCRDCQEQRERGRRAA